MAACGTLLALGSVAPVCLIRLARLGLSAPLANFDIVPIGTGGKIDLYNANGNVNLIADIAGYILPSG